MPSDWIGHEIGVKPGTWRYAGKLELAESPLDYVEPVYDPDVPSVPETPQKSIVIHDPETREAYEVEMAPETLEVLAENMTRMGYASPSSDEEIVDEATSSEFVHKGWSDGVDNRVLRGISVYGTTAWPYRAMGTLKSDGSSAYDLGYCTGTFLGAGSNNTRYVITAAHCLYDSNGNTIDPDFWPRQDSCLTEQLGTVESCDPAPYGQWDGAQTFVWTYFANNCAGDATPPLACLANDIAVLRVTKQQGAIFPGGLAFGYYYPSFLDSRSKFSRGYPNCNNEGDPSPADPQTWCLQRTLYGDGAFSIDDGNWFLGDFPRLYKFSADISGNHSGSASYIYVDGYGASVFGVAVSESCVGSNCSGTLVNTMRAIDQGTYNQILAFMGL